MKTPEVVIDVLRHRVLIGKKEVHLTPREFDTLRILKAARGGVTSRSEIMMGWGEDGMMEHDTRTVDQVIARIRKKIGSNVVQTVASYGYKIP